MRAKLDTYRVFCEVAHSGSISRAANTLFMTQPAVSQSISQLEKSLGIRLFNRTPRGVSLTQEGRLIYEYARTAINLLETGEQKLYEMQGLLSGELRLGVGDTATKLFLLPFLDKFHKLYPDVSLNLVNRTSLELCELLKNGEIDIALCNLPVDDPAIQSEPCMAIHDVFVAGPAYRDKIDHPLTFQELAQLPLIFLERKANSRRYVEQFLLSRGILLAPQIELGSHDLLISLAEINLGISCVIREFSLEALEAQTIFEVPLVENIPERYMGLCYMKRVPLAPGARKFSELIREGLVHG